MKNIENHIKAAKYLEEAAKQHHQAAKYHEAGNHDKAHHCIIKAHGFTAHAVDVQKEIVKEHTFNIPDSSQNKSANFFF